MIDLCPHWLAPESTPTGWRYWLRGASVLVTAAVPRARAGSGGARGPLSCGERGAGREPGENADGAAARQPRWASAVWSAAAPDGREARTRGARATPRGPGAEAGRAAVRPQTAGLGRAGAAALGDAPSLESGPCLPRSREGLGLGAPLLGPLARAGGGQVREHVGRGGAGGPARSPGACCGDGAGPAPVALESARAPRSSVETRAAPRPPGAQAAAQLRAAARRRLGQVGEISHLGGKLRARNEDLAPG